MPRHPIKAIEPAKPAASDRKSAFRSEGYEEPKLEAKLDPRLALGTVHIMAVGFFAALFWLLNMIPLRGSDLWCHVLYGRWIIEHGRLPLRDMTCPLLTKTPLVDSAWLSQVIFAGLLRIGGPELLSTLFSVVVSATFIVFCLAFYRSAWSLGVALAATAAVFIVDWSRLFTIRPEIFGYLCFAIVLWIVAGREADATGDRPPALKDVPAGGWLRRACVFVVFAFWANLHGSFVVGLAALGCCFVGQVLERLWATRSPQRVASDRRVREALLLGAIAICGTLINPYGPRLLVYAFSFSGLEHLGDLVEWRPMTWTGPGGREFAFSIVLLIVFSATSRARRSAAHLLMLGLFGYLAVHSVRMIGWYAAVYGLAITPHLSDAAARWIPAAARRRKRPWPRTSDTDTAKAIPPGRSFYHTLVCGLLIWIALALSPTGAMLLGRPPRRPDQLFDSATPLGAVHFLRERPVEGLVFNPLWWGDWLVLAGPRGAEPMMTANVHLCPPGAWNDYVTISTAGNQWHKLTDAYRVTAMMLDRRRQAGLYQAAIESGAWKSVYEDDQAVVLVRATQATQGATR